MTKLTKEAEKRAKEVLKQLDRAIKISIQLRIELTKSGKEATEELAYTMESLMCKTYDFIENEMDCAEKKDKEIENLKVTKELAYKDNEELYKSNKSLKKQIEQLRELIDKARKNNTHKTAKGEWTVPDNQLTITVAQLEEALKDK